MQALKHGARKVGEYATARLALVALDASAFAVADYCPTSALWACHPVGHGSIPHLSYIQLLFRA
ncbi:MAG: hypothetical protein BWY85_01908 [Firmicutes bacterium ADurb.Bin506]|nr:MAG: hypothetical protein BWY85_01908 [Firmicutes bacterium ADurb.Bin506]